MADSDAQLAPLVRGIADSDGGAIVRLHALLWARMRGDLRAVLPDPADADAVATATFLELWLLARFHSGPHADVWLWIDEILARRSADRADARGAGPRHDGRPSADPPEEPLWTALARAHDRITERALATLLAVPVHDTVEGARKVAP